MEKNSKIFLTGHKGMVGSAIDRLLSKNGYTNVIKASRQELDLKRQADVESFFEKEKPEYVILAAAKVGGIKANMTYPADFLYENLAIQLNIFNACKKYGVKKIIFLGSSCIYPKACPQPMKEDYLLTGELEPTNEGYAIAKIAGIKMAETYSEQYGMSSLSVMPCNLYGPNDSFDLQHSHVLSALVRRFVDAKNQNTESITLWGTGIARREFMHVDDMAEAVYFMLKNYDSSQFINVGWGKDISIKELAELIAKKVGYSGKILWDATNPDGMLRKCMDVSRMKELGFEPKISLSDGIDQMIEIYKENYLQVS